MAPPTGAGPFYCIFTATAAATQQARHITAATISGVIQNALQRQSAAQHLWRHWNQSRVHVFSTGHNRELIDGGSHGLESSGRKLEAGER